MREKTSTAQVRGLTEVLSMKDNLHRNI